MGDRHQPNPDFHGGGAVCEDLTETFSQDHRFTYWAFWMDGSTLQRKR